MIVTPFQLARRAQFYYQLAQMTEAGLSLVQALRTVRNQTHVPSLRRGLDAVAIRIGEGDTFGTALARAADWLPPFDIALMAAGEKSGRLPSCFKKLASYYEERAKILRRTLWSLAYPVFLMHLAVLIFPVTALTGLVLQGTVGSFILKKALLLAPFYIGVGVVAYLAQGTRGELVRASLDRVLDLVPVVGGARRCMALPGLTMALEALINAGTDMIQSWSLAAAASGSSIVHSAVRQFPRQLEQGRTPAELVGESRVFPPEFAQQYYSAELSGKIDETLLRLHLYYEEQANSKTRLAVVILGGLVFGAVILAVAWQIVSFWMGYFDQVGQAIGG